MAQVRQPPARLDQHEYFLPRAIPDGVFVEGAQATLGVSGEPNIAGSSTGVLAIQGANAGISDDSISASTTGVEFEDDATGSLSGNHFDAGASNVTDLHLATTGAVTVSGDFYAASSLFINNDNPDDQRTAEHFNTPDNAVIETKINHKLDDPALGLVTWNASHTLYVSAGNHLQYN